MKNTGAIWKPIFAAGAPNEQPHRERRLCSRCAEEDGLSTKHFCDGCDKEKPRPKLFTLSVSYGTGISEGARQFDLCESCCATFKSQHLPDKWARLGLAMAAE